MARDGARAAFRGSEDFVAVRSARYHEGYGLMEGMWVSNVRIELLIAHPRYRQARESCIEIVVSFIERSALGTSCFGRLTDLLRSEVEPVGLLRLRYRLPRPQHRRIYVARLSIRWEKREVLPIIYLRMVQIGAYRCCM